MYRESNYQKVNLVNVEPQVGPNDCGLFCEAYDQMLAYGRDPFSIKLECDKHSIFLLNLILYKILDVPKY
ncbi:hypothetical protein BpHYR1_021153 [Brachionus plicatilis]|uniref:Uncharacterized protein n=1 Tax=Brachionus plicatilis TaxID=10195 RepID=A0A3M7PM30_BRAPC|nr:hypothetical protein BpHYR1_021153 [Brachionus plicatilis]